MMTALAVMGVAFVVGTMLLGVLNRRSSPAPGRSSSNRDSGAGSAGWSDSSGSEGTTDCDAGTADCGDGGGGGE